MNVVTNHGWLSQRLFDFLAILCMYFFSGSLLLISFCQLTVVLKFPMYRSCQMLVQWLCYLFGIGALEDYLSSLYKVHVLRLNKRSVCNFLHNEFVRFFVTVAFMRVKKSGNVINPLNLFWNSFGSV